jgi:hypothetical protein
MSAVFIFMLVFLRVFFENVAALCVYRIGSKYI